MLKKNCIGATIRARQEIPCQFQLDLYMNIHVKKISKALQCQMYGKYFKKT